MKYPVCIGKSITTGLMVSSAHSSHNTYCPQELFCIRLLIYRKPPDCDYMIHHKAVPFRQVAEATSQLWHFTGESQRHTLHLRLPAVLSLVMCTGLWHPQEDKEECQAPCFWWEVLPAPKSVSPGMLSETLVSGF